MTPRNAQRLRCAVAILGITVCVVSYKIIWNDEIITGVTGGLQNEDTALSRKLDFLDKSPPPKFTGVWKSSPQYTSLVQPRSIKPHVHNNVAAYDPKDIDDSSCDGILLFMPSQSFSHNGHGSQLNSYVLAAMIATYTNKAMLILDHPYETSDFKGGSQFGCPKEVWKYDENGKNLGRTGGFPWGLERLVKQQDWLTRKCPLPCQESHQYEDWAKFKQSSKGSTYYPRTYTPQEVKCRSSNGRHTSVLVIGAEETRDYFEGHFKERMVQRPSKDLNFMWAVRLGASPEEAEAFAELEDEKEIWDYISALMARSGVLRFQPWIARDVEEYIKQSELPLEEGYDAIHVRRTDMLAKQDDASPKSFVRKYWKSRDDHLSVLKALGLNRDYIGFDHYLDQLKQSECQPDAGDVYTPPRAVYVATDDPTEVQQEIDNMKDFNNDCHKYKFILSPAKDIIQNFHLDDLPEKDHGDCRGRYKRNIASVADMMISAKSDTFVGEFNSSWGRLVRMFRIQLKSEVNIETGEQSFDVVEKKMSVAWGNENPLPPGM